MKNELTIFYTDDDQEDLEFFSEVTTELGDHLNLVTQNNGQKLIDALHNPPPNPHIIFLDLNMPGVSGFDVLEKLRKIDKFKLLPIVIFSTSNDEKIIRRSMDLGASYYIPKQTDFSKFKRSIEHTLNINWNTFITTKNNFVYTNN